MICSICGHTKGLAGVSPDWLTSCGCGCHALYPRPVIEQAPEILDFTKWPMVSMMMMPNGMRGVRLVYPGMAFPGLDCDELAVTMEPERARRLRDNLSALLKEMGL